MRDCICKPPVYNTISWDLVFFKQHTPKNIQAEACAVIITETLQHVKGADLFFNILGGEVSHRRINSAGNAKIGGERLEANHGMLHLDAENWCLQHRVAREWILCYTITKTCLILQKRADCENLFI